MPAHFEIKRTKDRQTMLNLRAANGEVILTSERYTTKAGAMRGIASVRNNSQNDGRFTRNASGVQHYFNLLAMNRKIIGTSERYTTMAALEKGVASVKKNAPEAVVKDA